MSQFRTGIAFLPIFGITPDTERSNPGGGSPCQAPGGDPWVSEVSPRGLEVDPTALLRGQKVLSVDHPSSKAERRRCPWPRRMIHPAPSGCVRPGLRATRPITTAMSDPERFGPVAPAPCPSGTAVPIGQRSATRAIACSGPGCPGPTPVPCTGSRPRSARSRSNPRSVSVERADGVHAPVGGVHSRVGAVARRRVCPARTRRGEGAVTVDGRCWW